MNIALFYSHNSKKNILLKKEYPEYYSMAPVFMFWVSALPIMFWGAVMIFGEKTIGTFLIVYLIILIVLIIGIVMKSKYIQIDMCNQNLKFQTLGMLLIGLITIASNTEVGLHQKREYTIPIHISDIVIDTINFEESDVEYHMSSNLASYTKWWISTSEQDMPGYLFEYSIFQCGSEYIRNKVKHYNYELERYEKIEKVNWKVDSIYSCFCDSTKNVKNYYIEYQDKIITIKTNIYLDKEKIEVINNLLIGE